MSSGILAKSLYVLFGALYLTAGTIALLFRTDLLPDVLKNALFEIAGEDLNAVHICFSSGLHRANHALVCPPFRAEPVLSLGDDHVLGPVRADSLI
jgi:hypothetical protein